MEQNKEEEDDISPQGEDDERLSKQDDIDIILDSGGLSSDSGELPRLDVPEVFSEEEDQEDELNTMEM